MSGPVGTSGLEGGLPWSSDRGTTETRISSGPSQEYVPNTADMWYLGVSNSCLASPVSVLATQRENGSSGFEASVL